MLATLLQTNCMQHVAYKRITGILAGNVRITYFENHRDYMRYDKYLLEGYPVASGVIESACRHLIQNRMERASAQWSILGAESVLKMRCVKANRDWALFQQMRKQQERERMYSEIIKIAA